MSNIATVVPQLKLTPVAEGFYVCSVCGATSPSLALLTVPSEFLYVSEPIEGKPSFCLDYMPSDTCHNCWFDEPQHDEDSAEAWF